jgi:hypothetical protein
MRAGFRKFSKKNSCIARARRGRAGLKGPRPDLTMTGRCNVASSAGSSKFKIRTSSRNKAQLALLRDKVRILIFDDPAELSNWQRTVMVRSGRGRFRPARPSRASAMHEFFLENLRNPARIRRAADAPV